MTSPKPQDALLSELKQKYETEIITQHKKRIKGNTNERQEWLEITGKDLTRTCGLCVEKGLKCSAPWYNDARFKIHCGSCSGPKCCTFVADFLHWRAKKVLEITQPTWNRLVEAYPHLETFARDTWANPPPSEERGNDEDDESASSELVPGSGVSPIPQSEGISQANGTSTTGISPSSKWYPPITACRASTTYSFSPSPSSSTRTSIQTPYDLSVRLFHPTSAASSASNTSDSVQSRRIRELEALLKDREDETNDLREQLKRSKNGFARCRQDLARERQLLEECEKKLTISESNVSKQVERALSVARTEAASKAEVTQGNAGNLKETLIGVEAERDALEEKLDEYTKTSLAEFHHLDASHEILSAAITQLQSGQLNQDAFVDRLEEFLKQMDRMKTRRRDVFLPRTMNFEVYERLVGSSTPRKRRRVEDDT